MKDGSPNKEHVSWVALGIIITILLFVFSILFTSQGKTNDNIESVKDTVGRLDTKIGNVQTKVDTLSDYLLPKQRITNR